MQYNYIRYREVSDVKCPRIRVNNNTNVNNDELLLRAHRFLLNAFARHTKHPNIVLSTYRARFGMAGDLAVEIARALRDRGATLCTVEATSGGLIAAELMSKPRMCCASLLLLVYHTWC